MSTLNRPPHISWPVVTSTASTTASSYVPSALFTNAPVSRFEPGYYVLSTFSLEPPPGAPVWMPVPPHTMLPLEIALGLTVGYVIVAKKVARDRSP